MIKIFLDDVRDPPSDDWIVIRSGLEFIRWFNQNLKMPNVMSFDHDLGEDYTGYDVAKYMVHLDLGGYKLPPDFKFIIHSSNPVGAENIAGLFTSYLNFKAQYEKDLEHEKK